MAAALTPGVSIVIPTFPARATMLNRAVLSVTKQIRPVAAVHVAQDLTGAGAWGTRNRAMAAVETEWTGFLDDDDLLYPWHTERLLDAAAAQGADLVWGWFDVVGNRDPLDGRGRQFDVEHPHTVPITYLVRTELLRQAVAETGGFLPDVIGAWDDQDKPLFMAMARMGKTWCLPEDEDRHDITWRWVHHGLNTSGLPGRVRAA